MDIQFFQVICWKDYLFSHWIVLTPLKKTTGFLNVSPFLFCLVPCNYLFIPVPMPYFLVCCSFTVSLEIRLYKFSNLFFFFKIVLTTTDSLHSFINSRISLSIFTKKQKNNTTTLRGIALNLEMTLEKMVILTILSLPTHEHGISLYLFNSLIFLCNVLPLFSVLVLHILCYLYPYNLMIF